MFERPLELCSRYSGSSSRRPFHPPRKQGLRSISQKRRSATLKSSFYHIERVATKYQPYVITYDDQEVLNLSTTRVSRRRPVSMKSTERTGSIDPGLKGGGIKKSASVSSNGTSTRLSRGGVWKGSPRSWELSRRQITWRSESTLGGAFRVGFRRRAAGTKSTLNFATSRRLPHRLIQGEVTLVLE